MQLVHNKILLNRTLAYLVPPLKTYGTEFITKFSGIHKLAIGIGDDLYTKRSIRPLRPIFILISTEVMMKNFDNMIRWAQLQPYYITDYPYSGIGSKYHMLVIKYPQELQSSYDYFLAGMYDNMFTPQQIVNFYNYTSDGKEFVFDFWLKTKSRLLKEEGAKDMFLEELKVFYGDDINITREDIDTSSLDLPVSLFLKEEIFNYGAR